MWYDCQWDSHTQKNRQNLNFYRSHNGLQQWTGIHTAKQAVKGPEKYKMSQYSWNITIDLIYWDNEKRITINKQTKTSTGLQVPGLGQAHNVCGGVKPVSEHSNPPPNLGQWCDKTTIKQTVKISWNGFNSWDQYWKQIQ